MREKDAFDKWCPLAKAVDEQAPVTVNRTETGKPDLACKCIGHKCMAWIWYESEGVIGDTTRGGYCGAFAAPIFRD